MIENYRGGYMVNKIRNTLLIFLTFLDIICVVINCHLLMEKPNILALKSDYFALHVSIYS